MSSPLIRIKRSAVAGKVPHYPSQIDLGEFAINTADGKVFIAAGTEGVGVGTTVIEVGISTENLLTGIITSITINSTNLTVTNQISGISSGAAKVNTATDAGNQWHHVGFLDQRTGYQKIKTNGLTYNPSTGKLYAGIGSFGTITGALTGNVTGNITGNVTGNVTGDVTGNISGEVTASQLSVTGIATISGLTFPSSDGSLNQVLTTNGNGTLSFADQSGGGSTPTEETFTATAGQTVFTTSTSTNSTYIIVYLNGIKLRSSDYTQGTSGFTLSSSATAGDELDCIIYPASQNEDTITATEGQTVFTSSSGFEDTNFLFVFVNGVKMRLTSDYSKNSSNNTITFTSGLNVGDEVDIVIT